MTLPNETPALDHENSRTESAPASATEGADPASAAPSPPAVNVADETSSLPADAPAETVPVVETAVAAAAESDENGESDEGESDDSEDEAAPSSAASATEGPTGAGTAEEKKKRKRRRKKASAAGGGPEGPPLEATSAAVPSSREGNQRDKGPGKTKGGPPPRERSQFQPGEEVFGKVTAVLDHAIMVDLAGKALAIFDRSELAADDLVPAVGDRFVAQVLGDGSRGGLVILSRKLLREEETKLRLAEAFESKTPVLGLVTGVIRGGLEVYVEGVRTFAPASHVDLRLGADLTHLIGQQLPFYLEQYAKRGRDVVLSRKAMLEEETKKQRGERLAKLTPGTVVPGIVRSVVQWGVFVAIPSADEVEGLVHISEVSHDPRARVADLLKAGDTIDVKILRIDEKGKLWLSKKATEPDPWEEFRQAYAVGSRHKGTVTKIQPFGVFVSLAPGCDGLIPMADLSVKRIERPEDAVKEGQEIDVVVASVDPATKRIALHPAAPEAEADLKQRVAPHKLIKVVVVLVEARGLVVRILGATGRNARGFIPAVQTGTPRGTDLRKLFPVGSEHEVKVIEIDPRRGEAKLSVKSVREDSEKAAYSEYRASVAKEAKFGTFGDLLKKSQQP